MLIRQILLSKNIVFKEEWTDNGKCKNPETDGILRFDFYLPKYNCCIEYDGEQHFQANGGYYTEDFVAKVKERDNVKNQYCKNNNIRLIRIPYIDFSQIDFNYLEEKGVFNGESI